MSRTCEVRRRRQVARELITNHACISIIKRKRVNNMSSKFICYSAIALAVAISSISSAGVIEFSFEDRGSPTLSTETFGSQIEDAVLADLAANPVTITLNPDTGNSPDATSGNQGDARPVALQITAIAGSGTGATAHLNGSTLEFGIDSSGANPIGGTQSDSSTRFDSDFNESLTLSFSEDLFFREIDFNSLAGTDAVSYTHLTLPTNREV